MKKRIIALFAIVGMCLFASCDKEGISDNSLTGTWICVKEVETMSDGTVFTFTDKSDWSINGGKAVFPYLLTFSSDGVVTGKTFLEVDATPTSYSVKGEYIYDLGIQWAKIASNEGKTLVLELAESALELNNLAIETLYPREPLYVKVVATYNKK